MQSKQAQVKQFKSIICTRADGIFLVRGPHDYHIELIWARGSFWSQFPKWLRLKFIRHCQGHLRTNRINCVVNWGLWGGGNDLKHPNHVQTRPIHHVKHLSWRFWSHCKSFPKWKMTCNSKFPKMASFWFTFNLTFQHQISFKWIL